MLGEQVGVGILIALLTLVLVAVVLVFVGAPLRRARALEDSRLAMESGARSTGGAGDARAGAPDVLETAGARDDLEAAREAKYREIRDAELDYRTGKLSREDYQAIDADLRAEAIEILDRLEDLTPRDA
jgi:hypothetical protein